MESEANGSSPCRVTRRRRMSANFEAKERAAWGISSFMRNWGRSVCIARMLGRGLPKVNGRCRSGADVRGDLVEGALGTGNDFVGAKAFEDFGEFVEIAADDDGSLLVALAGALGDEEGSLDI